MKQFFKLYSIPLFLLGMSSQLLLADASTSADPVSVASANSISIDSGIGQATASAAPSVHEMFKDVPQEELLHMMEEGQQFIKYLEENGTPEEKMQFAQAMEETLQGFSEADWQEFEKIVETVQDKLPTLVIEPKETIKAEPIVEQAPKKEETKAIVVDNSLEKILHAIHKAINAILLKAKSDKILTERMTISWAKKDDFNEMARLLQSLNKKDHIVKLTSSKDEAIKSLLESIQNFNKRLQIENDQFVIADTFGLEIDKETTITNLKKLNKILEFFDSAIDSLLPKLIKFMEEYEPEALKKAKEADDLAKKSLENATKIEKQKRPIGNMMPVDRSPSRGSQNNAAQRQGQGYNQGGYNQSSPASSNIDQRRVNPVAVPNQSPSKLSGDQAGKSADKTAEKKEVKKSAYDKAIDSLEGYIESYGNKEVGEYMTTINKAGGIYKSFGTAIDEHTKIRAEQLRNKRNSSSLLPPEESFLQKYDAQVKAADNNFGRNTQAAHSYYADLRESIEGIADQINEMQATLSAIKQSLEQMNSKELEQLNSSAALKNFAQRIHHYHAEFKKVQHELRNKHKIHILQRQDPYEINAYNELATKVDNLHGLDKKIADTKAQLDTLHKSIKGLITRHRRDENKASSLR